MVKLYDILTLKSNGLASGFASTGYNPLIKYKWNTNTTYNDYTTDGVELFYSIASITRSGGGSVGGFTITDNSFNLTVDTIGTSGGYPRVVIHGTTAKKLGERFVLDIDIVVNSGTLVSPDIKAGATGSTTDLVEGNNIVILDTTAEDNVYTFSLDGRNLVDIDVTINSIKKVQQEPQVRYLKDSGSKPKYHAELFTGQGVKFNGVDQSVLVGNNVTKNNQGAIFFTVHGDTSKFSYIVDNWGANRLYIRHVSGNMIDLGLGDSFSIATGYTYSSGDSMVLVWNSGNWEFFANGLSVSTGIYNGTVMTETTNFYIGSRDGNFDFVETVISNVTNVDFVPTSQQIQAQYQSPETFLYREAGVLKSDTLSQEEIDSVVAYLPMCENDEYVRDYANYSEGVELTSGITPIGTTKVGDTYTATSSANDRVEIAIDESLITSTNSYFKAEVQLANSSPNTRVRLATNAGGFEVIGAVENASGLITILGKASTSFASMWVLIYPDVVTPFDGSVDILSYSVKELSGIYPIENYTNSCRDDAKNLNKGLQTYKWLRDLLGVPDGLSDFFEGDGVGYADTGWVHDSEDNFTIEEIIEINNDGDYELSGQKTPNMRLGQTPLNQAFFQTSSGSYTYNVSGGVHYLVMVINKLSDNADCYVNGTLVGSIPVGSINASKSFEIGKTDDEYWATKPIRLFKVHNKLLTQEEITKNYQSYLNQSLFGVALIDGFGAELIDGVDKILIG